MHTHVYRIPLLPMVSVLAGSAAVLYLSSVPMMRTKSRERSGAMQWASGSGQYVGHRGQEHMDTHRMDTAHPSGTLHLYTHLLYSFMYNHVYMYVHVDECINM